MLPLWSYRHVEQFPGCMNDGAHRHLRFTKTVDVLDVDFSLDGSSTLPGFDYVDGYKSSDQRFLHQQGGFL